MSKHKKHMYREVTILYHLEDKEIAEGYMSAPTFILYVDFIVEVVRSTASINLL